MTKLKTDTKTVLPFLQWVGGKRKILPELLSHIPTELNNYYEPFLGGGALFFAVKDKFKKCFLSDVNYELITSYNTIKNDPGSVAKSFQEHNAKHSKTYFYQIRNNQSSNDPVKISARFLYLNRYSFRGIYRINYKGQPCVSFSDRKYQTNIADKVKICSDALKHAMIYTNDFSFIEPSKNDFVYFDPPYHKSGEKFYTRLPFDDSQQIRLRDFVITLTGRGVKIMLSNSDTEFIRILYKDFFIRNIQTKYSIRQKNKLASEVIITNYDK